MTAAPEVWDETLATLVGLQDMSSRPDASEASRVPPRAYLVLAGALDRLGERPSSRGGDGFANASDAASAETETVTVTETDPPSFRWRRAALDAFTMRAVADAVADAGGSEPDDDADARTETTSRGGSISRGASVSRASAASALVVAAARRAFVTPGAANELAATLARATRDVRTRDAANGSRLRWIGDAVEALAWPPPAEPVDERARGRWVDMVAASFGARPTNCARRRGPPPTTRATTLAPQRATKTGSLRAGKRPTRKRPAKTADRPTERFPGEV